MTQADALLRMERMYRPQAGFYDLTRKYYLFGRDRLIDTMPVSAGDMVCEIGCGTGRNLARLARRDRTLRLFGLDASEAMLERARMQGCATLARGLAEELSPKRHFGLDRPFDRIFFSYALSMIPDWRGSISAGLASLRPGGTLAIVDFGGQRAWPAPLKRGLRAWLRLFHVHPVDELCAHIEGLAGAGLIKADFAAIGGGYAQLAILTKRS